MRGHIRKRGTGWSIVVDIGRDPASGKRKQKWHSGFRTRRDAERSLAGILQAIEAGTYVEASRETVGSYLEDRWLPAMKARLKESTWSSYEMNIRKHVVPRIGRIRLQALTPLDLNRLYADLAAGGPEPGSRALSLRTVRMIHAIIRKALRDAERWGLLKRNAAHLADPPSAAAERAARRTAMSTWDADQVRAFLLHVKDDRLASLWVVASMTGMRRGELLGLCWDRVDLDAGRIAVVQSLLSVDYRLEISDTKSGEARVIDIDPSTAAELKSHRARQNAERLALGVAYRDAGLVFAREDGTPLHPEQVTRWFRRHTDAAGLPRIRLHDLRHTHASLMIQAGVHPKIVQERLGHHSSAFTMDTYAHALPALQVDAARRVSDLIRG